MLQFNLKKIGTKYDRKFIENKEHDSAHDSAAKPRGGFYWNAFNIRLWLVTNITPRFIFYSPQTTSKRNKALIKFPQTIFANNIENNL